MADTINTGAGESVFFNYSATQNACEQINSISNDIKERIEQIKGIIDRKDSIWKGEAASRFWQDFNAIGKEYSLEVIDEITSNDIPKAVQGVLSLIEENKGVDSEIKHQTFTEAVANDNVQASSANVQAEGVNQEANNAVHANDNIQAQQATTDARGADQGLFDATHANDNIRENTSNVGAEGVNTQIIDSVHTNDNVQTSSSSVQAKGIDENYINSISTSGAFNNGNSSVNTTPTNNSTGNNAYDEILSSFLEKQ